MPIVRFSGLELEEKETILDMIQAIKVWVSSVKSLEVGPENVRPVHSSLTQENPGECVIFEVMELFSVSLKGTPRIPVMRKDLCQSIELGFNKFVATAKFNEKPKVAVVTVNTVDRAGGEFHSWNIPTSSEN